MTGLIPNKPLPPLRKVGDTVIQPVHRASCHCVGVVLELDLPEGVVDARRCTCSMCRRKGAVMGAVPMEGLRIVQGRELLSVYRFNTMTAEHYFCSRCGIYTHHRRRSKPNQYGYNLGCLEGVDPNQVQGVPVNDGVNHPADRGAAEPGTLQMSKVGLSVLLATVALATGALYPGTSNAEVLPSAKVSSAFAPLFKHAREQDSRRVSQQQDFIASIGQMLISRGDKVDDKPYSEYVRLAQEQRAAKARAAARKAPAVP